MKMDKKIALLNTSAPYSTSSAKDSLDLALIFGSYEQETGLFFQGDGVWQLIDNQQPQIINNKDFLKTYSALEFYDIEKLYVCNDSLIERSLKPEFHVDNVTVLKRNDFIAMLNNYTTIFKF